MVSIVAHRTEPGMLLVRARTEKHLFAILEPINRYAMIPIIRTPDADYEYRAIISKNDVEEMIGAQLDVLDYGNFKGRCDAGSDKTYAGMLHQVWQVVFSAIGKNNRWAKPARPSKPSRNLAYVDGDFEPITDADRKPVQLPHDGSRSSFLDHFRR
jgi:hypothetical protein